MRLPDPAKTPFTVWEANPLTIIPTDDSRQFKPHMYIVVASHDRTTKSPIATAVPISTKWMNDFSVKLPFVGHEDFLKHDSHVYCDHIVTFRQHQLSPYLGDITDPILREQIQDAIADYLGISV